MMIDTASILTITANLLVEVGRGILSNRADSIFCKTTEFVYLRLRDRISEPANHDIVISVRRARLNSTLLACKHLLASKYGRWEMILNQENNSLSRLINYLRKEIRDLNKGIIRTPYEKFDVEYKGLIYPKGQELSNRLGELSRKHKESMIKEIDSKFGVIHDSEIYEMILTGWNKEGKIIDWHDLTCALFTEEIKENSRLLSTIEFDLLLELDKNFKTKIKSLKNKQSAILEEIAEINKIIDKYSSQLYLKIEEDGDKTRQMLQDFRENLNKEILYHLENSKIGKRKPFGKYCGNLVDFFQVAPESESLRVEVAIDEKGKVVFFHDSPLQVELLRAEFFSEEQSLVLLGPDNQRRAFGAQIADVISEGLRKNKKLLLVQSDKNNPLGPYDTFFEIDLKVYY